jgi:putative peptide zinc metalloprotease protein
MILDSVGNRFFRLDWLDFELLSRWELGTTEAIINSVNRETTLSIGSEDLEGLIQFLQRHHLLQVRTADAVKALHKESLASRKSWPTWLLHNYLFMRFRLIQPQRLLRNVLPYVSWIFSAESAIAIFGLSVLGFFLALRQWDTFTTTLVDKMTFSGMASFAVALVFSKFMHEAAHALAATRYGLRVAHMGIAMLVLFPMPYTDVSESWKLTNARHRLQVAGAGILAELALAGLSTLAWSLAPDGSVRNALFVLATTSWVLTLAVNLSPFMRFDGYFILSDWLDFPNLHERSAALARTWFRRTALGLEEPWPEEFPRRRRELFITFACITWVYRLTVFIGIAWLVYEYFFKVLGIFLFVVEIWWFIVLPALKETMVWMQRRAEIRPSRSWVAVGLLAAFGAVGFIPWHTSVSGAAWVHAQRESWIYSPIAARVVEAASPGTVKKGQRIIQLHSPDLASDAARSQALADARGAEIRGLIGWEGGEARRAELQSEQDKFRAEVKLFNDELFRLDLIAPFDGELKDTADGLAPRAWVHPKQALAVVVDPSSWSVDMLVEERSVSRIKAGDKALVMMLRDSLEKIPAVVESVDTTRLTALPHPALDAQHGGPVQTFPGDKHIPVQSLYRVRLKLEAGVHFQQMRLGHVTVQTQARAWLPSIFSRVLAIILRESGF